MSSLFSRRVALLLIAIFVYLPVLSFSAVAKNPRPMGLIGDRPASGATEMPSIAEMTACTDAEAQALQDVNSTLWIAGGCLGGIIAIIVAQVVEPDPPATTLLGQSPEYVAEYTDCYKKAAKKRQTNRALIGCGIAAVVYGAYFLVLAITVDSATDF